MDDFSLMRRAIDVAAQNPKAPFGAVIAVDNSVIATGCNHTHQHGPIWHGEIAALQNAADTGFVDWSDATLATTAEPCPMCMSAILWAGVGRVVYGTHVPTLVKRGWNQFTLRATEVIAAAPFTTCELVGGVLEQECDALFPFRV